MDFFFNLLEAAMEKRCYSFKKGLTLKYTAFLTLHHA